MFLGVDIGTTRLKITVVDGDGNIVMSDSEEVLPDFGSNGEVEIDPNRWITGLRSLLKRHDLKNVESIGLSGQMHTLVLIDKTGRPVRKAMVWADSRGAEEIEHLNRLEILKRCGSLPSSAFTLLKILYLMRNETDVIERSWRFCLSKDFIGGWFTGNYDTEATDASATLMFDLEKGDWAWNIMRDLKVPERLFPEVHRSLDTRGYLKKDVAQELGLKPGIPVVYGAGDQESAAFGVGVLNPGDVMFSISTGSQIVIPVERPIIDDRIHNFRHVLGYHIMGAVQNAGLAVEWAMKILGFPDFDDMTEWAMKSPPGSNGVVFLPYITPERTPIMKHDVVGGFLDLRSGNTRADMARSVFEGVTFCVYDAWRYVEKLLKLENPEITVLGGVSKNPVVKETLSSLMRARMKFFRDDIDPSSYGASLMAGWNSGRFHDVKSIVERFISDSVEVREDERTIRLYERFVNRRSEIIGV